MPEPVAAYSADRSLKGKLRRLTVRWVERRPARLALDRPMVSFTFDDAPATALTTGRAALEARGLRGTYYVAVGLAGREGPQGRYGTQGEVVAAAAAGHEIACHTCSHLDCGAADGRRIADDVALNDAALAAWGVPRTANFAYPFGDVSRGAKRALGERFQVLRALHSGLIEDGTDLNQAPAVGVEGPGGEAKARAWLARAAARKAWLILYTHDVAAAPSPWGCTPEALDGLINTALGLGFDVVTVAEGARRIAA
jgi:peptidoglycan/xylan/chitin deacetylase (PgdA/CDA1 family)